MILRFFWFCLVSWKASEMEKVRSVSDQILSIGLRLEYERTVESRRCGVSLSIEFQPVATRANAAVEDYSSEPQL